jgi:hypothetical protein
MPSGLQRSRDVTASVARAEPRQAASAARAGSGDGISHPRRSGDGISRPGRIGRRHQPPAPCSAIMARSVITDDRTPWGRARIVRDQGFLVITVVRPGDHAGIFRDHRNGVITETCRARSIRPGQAPSTGRGRRRGVIAVGGHWKLQPGGQDASDHPERRREPPETRRFQDHLSRPPQPVTPGPEVIRWQADPERRAARGPSTGSGAAATVCGQTHSHG